MLRAFLFLNFAVSFITAFDGQRNIPHRPYKHGGPLKKYTDIAIEAIQNLRHCETGSYTPENPHDDHFASFIRSWCDWQIQPLTKRSGKKIETIDDSSGTLEQFF